MKKFFILVDIEGEILSGDKEFATEREAEEFAISQEIEDRVFIEEVLEVV